jgi:hypothetical protein
MASAAQVLKHALHDANLLVAYTSLESPEQLSSLLQLAQDALAVGDGEIKDDLLLHSSLHPVTLGRLGLRPRAGGAFEPQAASVRSA